MKLLGEKIRLWLTNFDYLDVDDFEGEDKDHKEIANLTMFILDAVVQTGATCERLLKDFVRFHTKSMSRLCPDSTAYQSTKGKHDIQRKYY